jgi:dTDP-4-dehydrorhamnose reductase
VQTPPPLTSSRIAVTGARGRLGRAVVDALGDRASAWDRAAFDLDHPERFDGLLQATRPALVIHVAGMTDVEAAARDPDLAMARNGTAVQALAAACRSVGAGLLVVSTNEVFDGTRQDGIGYSEDDPTDPCSPYGASKLAGELAAMEAYGTAPRLWIVRTSWLFGPPGNDFPTKIVAAADALPGSEPLRVVADEFGSPTSTLDLAAVIVSLIGSTNGGTYHVVNAGSTSRYGWAAHLLAAVRPGRTLRPISRSEFVRASSPPAWGVLQASPGIALPTWQTAVDRYVGTWAPG